MIKEGTKWQRQKAQSVGNDKALSSKNSVPMAYSAVVKPLATKAGCLCAYVPFRRGFTLVELLVVMVLMAIIIAISAPAFVGLGRGTGMRGAVRSVHSTLSLLRQWAITHREQVTFCYFQGVSGSESYYYATNEFGTAIISTNYNDKYSGSPRLPLEVMFDGDGAITFKTDGGLASGAISTNITIMDRKESTPRPTKTVSINGLTGGIRVE